MPLTALRPRALNCAEDIGNVLKGSQFWPRGRDTYSARSQCQPFRPRPGRQTHQA